MAKKRVEKTVRHDVKRSENENNFLNQQKDNKLDILKLINQKFGDKDGSNPKNSKKKIYSQSPEFIIKKPNFTASQNLPKMMEDSPSINFIQTTPFQIFPRPKNLFETPKKRPQNLAPKCRSSLQLPKAPFELSNSKIAIQKSQEKNKRLSRSLSRHGSVWGEAVGSCNRSVALSNKTMMSDEQAIHEINSLRNSVHSLNREKMDIFNQMTILGDKFANSKDENEKLKELLCNYMKTIEEYKVEIKKTQGTW